MTCPKFPGAIFDTTMCLFNRQGVRHLALERSHISLYVVYIFIYVYIASIVSVSIAHKDPLCFMCGVISRQWFRYNKIQQIFRTNIRAMWSSLC